MMNPTDWEKRWEEQYQRAMDMYSSRLWSKSKAMESIYVGDRGVEVTLARPADVDDWGPNERPEPEDLEAARLLLGDEPRPPKREAEPLPDQWDEPTLQSDRVHTMAQMVAQIANLKSIMEKNGAPQPNYIMVHPSQADAMKALLKEGK